MKSNGVRAFVLVAGTALATLVAAAPAGAAYENPYGVRHHWPHGRIHHHHYYYGYRYGPAGVVAGAGEAASGLFGAGVTAWDALDCVTFGYYCRR